MTLSSLFSLEGKTALVTGGSKGLGAMIAKGFVSAGCKVYISSRTAEDCERAALEISNGSTRCIALPGDVSSLAGIKALASDLSKQESAVNILVNNAGTVWHDSFEQFPENGWDNVLDTNLKSAFFLTQAMLPLLKAAASAENSSRVINVSSVAAQKTSLAGDFSYRISKAGMNQMTRVLARDLAKSHINVNAIAPGFFATDMSMRIIENQNVLDGFLKSNPIGRGGEESDIAGIAIYMAAKAGAYMTGDIVTVDGGRSLV